MGLGVRIRHFRTKANLTLDVLEQLSGVDKGTISALEVRDSSRSQYFPALAKALGMSVEQLGDPSFDPHIQVEFDSTGRLDRGEARVSRVFPVLTSGTASPAIASESTSQYGGLSPILAWEHEDDLPDGEFVMVPRLDVKLSAGLGGGPNQVEIQFSQQQPQAFRADWVRQQRLKPKKLAAMTGSGDSMEPSIYHGDSLLVDTSQTEVLDGKVYALWYDGGERVKRLYRLPGGGLRIKSDNPAYDPIVLGPDYAGHVRIIGRVVHRSGTGGL